MSTSGLQWGLKPETMGRRGGKRASHLAWFPAALPKGKQQPAFLEG